MLQLVRSFGMIGGDEGSLRFSIELRKGSVAMPKVYDLGSWIDDCHSLYCIYR